MNGLKRAAKAALLRLGLDVRRRDPSKVDRPLRYPITERVAAYLRRHGERFVVIDGGAGRWDFMQHLGAGLPADVLSLDGFDLDAAECDQLNRDATLAGLDYWYHPFGLWEKSGTAKFFVCREQSASSFFRPYRRMTDRWTAPDGRPFRDALQIEKTIEVPVISLADWKARYRRRDVDFIKLNVQGSELAVLRGAGKVLDSVLGIQLELGFKRTYSGAPLFSDIDPFLREKGFEFFEILALNHVGAANSPLQLRVRPELGYYRWPSKQLLEGHFLYLRDPLEHGGDWSPVQVLKLAALAEVWGQVEFALELLACHGDEQGAEAFAEYADVYKEAVMPRRA